MRNKFRLDKYAKINSFYNQNVGEGIGWRGYTDKDLSNGDAS